MLRWFYLVDKWIMAFFSFLFLDELPLTVYNVEDYKRIVLLHTTN